MMPEAFDRWWNEFKYESPWCFWVYSLLMPLGLPFFFQPSLAFCMLVSQGMAAWLLKKWGLLEQKWLYVLAVGCFFTADHLVDALLGDSLHMIFLKKYKMFDYPRVYALFVYTPVAAFLAFVCVFCAKRKVQYALQVSTCVLFLLMATYYGLIMLWGLFALMYSGDTI